MKKLIIIITVFIFSCGGNEKQLQELQEELNMKEQPSFYETSVTIISVIGEYGDKNDPYVSSMMFPTHDLTGFYLCQGKTINEDTINVLVRRKILLLKKMPIKGYCSEECNLVKHNYKNESIPFFSLSRKPKKDWDQIYKVPVVVISSRNGNIFSCNAIIPTGDTIEVIIGKDMFYNIKRPFNGFINGDYNDTEIFSLK